MTNEPPVTLIIGMIDGQWPVQAFISDTHALDWIAEGTNQPGNRRHLWRVTLALVEELTVVPPVPARLAPAEQPADPS